MSGDDERRFEERERRNQEDRTPDPNTPWVDRIGRLIAEPPGEQRPEPPGVTWPKIGDFADDYGYTPSEADWARMREAAARLRQNRRTEEIASRPLVCTAFQVRRAGRVTTRLFNLSVRPRKPLRITQLAVLAAMANGRAARSISDLAARLGMHRTTLSRSLTRLAKRGLVDVAPDPNDRRGRLPKITREGREALTRHADAWKMAEAELAIELGFKSVHPRSIHLVRAVRRRMAALDIAGAREALPHAFGAGSEDSRAAPVH